MMPFTGSSTASHAIESCPAIGHTSSRRSFCIPGELQWNLAASNLPPVKAVNCDAISCPFDPGVRFAHTGFHPYATFVAGI